MSKGILGRKGVNSGLAPAEVLVVIVVAAFLMSILVPALARVKTASQEEVKCKANLRQVGIVIHMFLQDEDFRMPDCHVISWSSGSNRLLWTTDGRESSPRLSPDDDDSYWGTAYNKYVKDINIFRCPAMAQFLQTLAPIYVSYPLHPSVDPNDVAEQASFGLNGYTDQLNANAVRKQAEVLMCTDHVEPRNEQAHEWSHGDMFCMGVATRNLSHFRPGSPTPARMAHYRGIFRHNIRKDDDFETGGRASVLWLDGRVTTIEETTGENVPNRWYDPRGRGYTDDIGWLEIGEANYTEPPPDPPPPPR